MDLPLGPQCRFHFRLQGRTRTRITPKHGPNAVLIRAMQKGAC